MADYKEAFEKSLKYFNGDELAAQVFLGKYALTTPEGDILEVTPDDMHKRIAKELARIEKKYPNPLSEEEIYNYIKNFRYIVPQGSPMAGIGNPYQIVSLSNCFVIETPYDSYGGILKTDQEQAQLMKRRGGVGFDISSIRPRNMKTSNAAKTTEGIGVFMERFSNTCREVGQGGRRGALMLTISVHHPEIRTFINIKRDLKKVTGANISIRLTDEFMQAVMNSEKVQLRWPVDEKKNPVVQEEVDAQELWHEIIESAWASAEPGLIFWDTVKRMSPADAYKDFGFETISTNPCFSGDTLIATADGRNAVPIKKLAEEGKDVLVYSVNSKTGKVEIKTGRNPRVTGTKKKLLKVTLDDGSAVKVTPEHKMILRDGTVKLAKDLLPGDSLPLFSKTVTTMNKNGNEYYVVNTDTRQSPSKKAFEHRLIAKFTQSDFYNQVYREEKNNGWLKGGLVVHHKDYNGLNNSPDNLEIMTFREHQKFHAAHDNKGENNGRYVGKSSDEIFEAALNLTKKLGRRFSHQEWQSFAAKNGFPQTFASMHHETLGKSPRELSQLCALELGLEHIDDDPRLVKSLQKMLKQGYEAKIFNGVVWVSKKCESCQRKFKVPHTRREISFCSHSCSLQYVNSNTDIANNRNASIRRYAMDKAKKRMDKQASIWNSLKLNLGRTPTVKEWEKACHDSNVPCGLSKHAKYGFKTYDEVCKAGEEYNHKVVSVEEVEGLHTVYNITVDDNHTVALVTQVRQNKNGADLFRGIFAHNCGEITLSAYDSCRLLLLNTVSFVDKPFTKDATFDYEKFTNVACVAQRLMDDIIDLELECVDRILQKIENDPEPLEVKQIEINLWNKIKQSAINGRRTGLGVTAIGDMLAALNVRYGSEESIEIVENVYKHMALGAYRSSVTMAKERGPFPVFDYNLEKDHPFINRIMDLDEELKKDWAKYGRRNIALTTTAPAGSVSILTQTTSGIEPAFLLSYTRRRKINPNDKISRVDFVDPLGDKWQEYTVYHHWFKKWMEQTGKSNPEESPYYKATSNDIDWVNKVKMQAAAQKWVCHSISNCVSEGTVITTNQGHYKIEELAKHAKVKKFAPIKQGELYSRNKHGNAAKITEVYNNGVEQTLLIQCDGGYEIQCTPRHQLVTFDKNGSVEWKKASELSVGDVVVGQKGHQLWNKNVHQQSLEQLNGSKFVSKNNSHHKLPQKMSKKLARLFGYMCSNGLVTETGIKLLQVKKATGDDFQRLVADLFGLQAAKVNDRGTTSSHTYQVKSRKLSQFFEWLGMTNCDKAEVPRVVRLAGKSHVKEFIKGLTISGRVLNNNISVVKSANKALLQQTQTLLLNMGIVTNLTREHSSNNKTVWCLYTTDATETSRYVQSVGFVEPCKDSLAKSKFGTSDKLRKLDTSDKNFYVLWTVKSVSYGGEVQTYDLSVPNGNAYIANGFTSHNTTNVPENTTVDTIKDIYMTGWKSGTKGVTVYRDKCRTGVLVSEESSEENRENTFRENHAPKRPEKLPCDIYHMQVRGERWNFFVGLYNDKPYEIFAGRAKHIQLPRSRKSGYIKKNGTYNLYTGDGDNELVIEDLATVFENPTESAFTRTVSLALRHGAPVQYIVEQIEKGADKENEMFSLAKGLMRVLKHYIADGTKPSLKKCPNCGSDKLAYQEGCIACTTCGHSKCG